MPPGTSCASTEKPSSFGSWATKTVSAMPFMYPTRTGFESRSVRNPTRASAATAQRRPVRIASIEASAMARASSPPEAATTVAAMSAASPESGPSTMIRDGPKTAYARRGTIVA